MAKIWLCAAALLAASLLAACGGSGKGASNASGNAASGNASSSGKVSQADCDALSSSITDLALSDSAGFDYVKARKVFDNFSPPDKIHDDFNRVKDFVDKLASAEQDAGVKPGDIPVGDQIGKIKGKIHYSDSDKAKNDQALSSVNAYTTNGCD